MSVTVGAIVITQDQDFFEAGLGVLNDIKEHVLNEVIIDIDLDVVLRRTTTDPIFLEAKSKAIRYLKNQKETINAHVIQASSLDAARDKIIKAYEAHQLESFQVGTVYYDHCSTNEVHQTVFEIDDALYQFYQDLKDAGIPSFYSSFSAAVFVKEADPHIRVQPMQYIECVMPEDRTVLQTELLCLWMDFFENSYNNRRIKPKIETEARSRMGQQLIAFLSNVSNNDWLMSYYTGSVVSGLINYMDMKAVDTGGLVLRGPNEHSLACGAIANWMLYQKPFVVVVTSAMISEFKGTLANLREARAKGFIIVADSRSNQWFPFQGTITADEDTRDVLKAQRLPFVYMEKVDDIDSDLSTAFELFDANEGPVILLTAPKVLDYAVEANELLIDKIVRPQPTALEITEELQENLDQVMETLNNGPEKVLWQLGPLTQEENDLVQEIAHSAGIALVDSLAHPGSVPKYINNQLNPYYLGTLSIYGYSPRVYSYLYTNNKLNTQSDQSLFFIKSKITEIATPFTEGRLQNMLHITQLTNNPSHIAPFTNVPVVMDCKSFLTYVRDNLSVSDELKRRRVTLMNSYHDSPSDVISKLPKLPMSPNYFFNEFNQLIEDMIINKGFDYTGVYDVGRCGISAVRNVASTRRGFSGWYGRALMGDALLASLSLAHTTPSNVIAFIGDGAAGIVPDIMPSFIENAITHPETLNKNITILFFCNGGHSVISTYQERILFNRTSRQMRLVNIQQPDWEETICGIKVVSKNIHQFSREELEEALNEPRRLNLFSVHVSHNNEGDGITLATATGWQRDPALASDFETLIKDTKSSENSKSPSKSPAYSGS